MKIFFYYLHFYIFLSTNKLFYLLFSIFYNNLVYFSFHYAEDLYFIYYILNMNKFLEDDIDLFSHDISIYLQQDQFKNYYGSVNRQSNSVLMASFYKNYIINIE